MLSEIILGGLVFLVALLAWLLHGATNSRLRESRHEMEEWSGVTDVKRKTRDKLHDPDYIERVQDKFNK